MTPPHTPRASGSSPLEKRVEKIEGRQDRHEHDDGNQFAALRVDIAKLGADLSKKITDLGENLQGQIDKFTLDKARAEGKAEGLAEGKRPNAWAIAVTPTIVGAIAAALLTWVGLDLSRHTATVTTTTTATMPAKAP